jgi:hypothetical protein
LLKYYHNDPKLHSMCQEWSTAHRNQLRPSCLLSTQIFSPVILGFHQDIKSSPHHLISILPSLPFTLLPLLPSVPIHPLTPPSLSLLVRCQPNHWLTLGPFWENSARKKTKQQHILCSFKIYYQFQISNGDFLPSYTESRQFLLWNAYKEFCDNYFTNFLVSSNLPTSLPPQGTYYW